MPKERARLSQRIAQQLLTPNIGIYALLSIIILSIFSAALIHFKPTDERRSVLSNTSTQKAQ